MFSTTILVWVGFNLFVLAMLALDLGVFHRKAHDVSIKEASLWSVAWVALALTFNVGLYFWRGGEVALQFLTGYLIEKSLSVDNIFVFVLLFAFFAVPNAYQHRVLFYGIIGALIMRGIMIAAGAALIKQFHWIVYVFGAFLIVTGIRMAQHRNEELHPEQNPLIWLVRRVIPVSGEYHGERFFIRQAGKLVATPLFLALVLVEFTDLLFAVDSIPAIFAVTTDPFIVYTSNVFAILGLRSLYFVLRGVVDRFVYLKLSLAAVLTFVGAKMVLTDLYKVPVALSLAIIAAILAVGIVASLLHTRRVAGSVRADPDPAV